MLVLGLICSLLMCGFRFALCLVCMFCWLIWFVLVSCVWVCNGVVYLLGLVLVLLADLVVGC